jgi:arylsulfatase A-like enzyme
LISLLLVMIIIAAGLLLRKWDRHPQPNILWITMDSLRSDHLGCSGHPPAITPAIDALAQEGVLFTQCIAQSNYTNISVPSMVTGRYPTLLDVRTPLHDLDDLFVTLAEYLSQREYATYAILPDWSPGINQGFGHVQTLESDTDVRTRACLDILDTLKGGPFFIWLYYWDPHAPYLPPEEFAQHIGTELPLPDLPDGVQLSPQEVKRWRRSRQHLEGWEMMKEMVRINEGVHPPEAGYGQRLMGLYDAEISFVDSRIASVVSRIKSLGLWDRTMVVLNADHGEGFGEHGLFFHGYGLYEEEIRVPLVIKPPRSRPSAKVVAGTVRNLDIMPTVLDYCGIEPPGDIDGVSLRPCMEREITVDLPAAMESNTPEKGVHLVGFRHGGYKVIYRRGSPPELYDLAADPQELTDLLAVDEVETDASESDVPDHGHPASEARRREAELRKQLLATYGVASVDDLIYTYSQKQIDPQNRERLRALGYIY